MTVRILVADDANARLYELPNPHALDGAGNDVLTLVAELSDPTAHLHDRDLLSDRPGRKLDRAPLQSGRRGATARHGTGEGPQPRLEAAKQFVQRIALRLQQAEAVRPVDQLVLVAAPRMLGLLRAGLPAALRAQVVDEVHRDLAHAGAPALLEHLRAERAAGRLLSGHS